MFSGLDSEFHWTNIPTVRKILNTCGFNCLAERFFSSNSFAGMWKPVKPVTLKILMKPLELSSCESSATYTCSYCIVFLAKTLLITLTVPLSTRVYEWIPENLLLGVTLWTGTLSRGVTRNTPLLLHATETGIRNHLARMNTSRTEATVPGRRYKKNEKNDIMKINCITLLPVLPKICRLCSV